MSALPILNEIIGGDFLQCPLCGDPYTSPTILPCLHSTCLKCLHSSPPLDAADPVTVVSTQNGDASARGGVHAVCPVCADLGIGENKQLKLHSDNLKQNHFLANLSDLAQCHQEDPKSCDYCHYDNRTTQASHRCLECHDNLCDKCVDAHRRTKVTRSHQVAPFAEMHLGKYDRDIRRSQNVPCGSHQEEALKFFCSKCDMLICRECKVCGHEGHPCTDLSNVCDAFKGKAKILTDAIKRKFPSIEILTEFLTEYNNYLKQKRQEVTETIEKQAAALHRFVDAYKDRLIEEVDQKCKLESDLATNRKARAQALSKALKSTISYTDVLLAHGKPAEILASRDIIMFRLGDLTHNNVEPLTTKMTMSFKMGHVTEQSLESIFGSLHCASVPLNNSSPTTKQSAASPTATSPKSLLNNVALKNLPNGKIPPENMLQIKVAQASPPQRQRANRQPHSSPTRNLTNGGILVISNNINGQFAPGSCTNIGETVELLNTFECSGPTDTKDMWPTGLAVTEDDRVVVMDRENKKVKFFTRSGHFVREFGQGTLGCAYDIAVLRNGNLAVTDYDQEDVKIYTPDGALTAKLKGPMKYPRGIAVGADGNIIIVDAHSHRLIVHEPVKGKVVRIIEGKDGTHGDLLSEPYYVTTNAVGNIIVTDWVAPNIKIFTAEGHYITKYNTITSRDQTFQPYGVCTDRHGNIYVADNQNHRIHLLNPEGKFIKFVVSRQHSLWHPMAVVINVEGHLVVTEALGKIKTFKLT